MRKKKSQKAGQSDAPVTSNSSMIKIFGMHYHFSTEPVWFRLVITLLFTLIVVMLVILIGNQTANLFTGSSVFLHIIKLIAFLSGRSP
jgi:hypothetical protein